MRHSRSPSLPRPLPPDEWYPAGESRVSARQVALRGGERVRVVELPGETSPAVLLLHGWGASAYNFRLLLPLLERAGIRAVAPDLRGHGLSDKPHDARRYTQPEMVTHVLDLMDAVGLSRAVVLGQSMGGALAFDTAMSAPDRVSAVVMAAPIGLTPIRRITAARVLRADWWLPYRIPRRAIEMLLQRVYGTVRRFSERDVDEYWAPTQFEEFPRALMSYVMAFDWRRRAASGGAALPRLHVVLGELDKLIPAPRAAAAARALGAESVHVARGAGHLLAEEVPELLAGVLRRAAGAAPNEPASRLP